MHDDVPRALRAPRKSHATFHPARAQGLQRRRRLRASAAAHRRPASAAASSTREGRYLEADFATLTVISVYLPSGSSGPHRQASKFRFLDAFLPHLAQAARSGARNHPVRRLEHRAPADRPQELAQQPEELRLPAGGARVADARVRRARLRRRVPPRRSAARAVHVVVEPRAGVGEERRLAHRLPDRDAGHRRDGARGVDLHEPALFRSRAAHHRLRLRAAYRRRRSSLMLRAHQPHARPRHQAPARRRER